MSKLDARLVTASEAGINIILIMGGTPPWALKDGYSCGAIALDKLETFGLFVFDAVQRYSAPPYNIKYWEFWNEPDVVNALGCWGDDDVAYYGGAYYAEMLKVAYIAAKAANPDAQVLIGGLLLDCDPVHPPAIPDKPGEYRNCTPATFLEGILAVGGGDYFDGVSFHAYDYYQGELGKYGNSNWNSLWNTTGPVVIAKANYIRNLLARYNQEEKYLMNTEVAVICGRDGSEAPCQTEAYQQTKAFYAAQVYAAIVSLNIQNNIWYSLYGWRGSGLLARDSSPLPLYHAFAFSSAQLSAITASLPELAYDTDQDGIANVLAYRFEKDAQLLWLIWSLDGLEHEITLPATPSAAYDVYGNTLPIPGNTWITTLTPVYLVWGQ